MAAKVLLFSILTRRSEIVPQSNMLPIDFEVVQNSIELVCFKQQALKKTHRQYSGANDLGFAIKGQIMSKNTLCFKIRLAHT